MLAAASLQQGRKNGHIPQMLRIRIRIGSGSTHENIEFLKKNWFSLKLFLFFFFKIDNISLNPGSKSNYIKILDPDPILRYLDPQYRTVFHHKINCLCFFSTKY